MELRIAQNVRRHTRLKQFRIYNKYPKELFKMEKTLTDEELLEVRAAVAERLAVKEEEIKKDWLGMVDKPTKNHQKTKAEWSHERLKSVTEKLEGCDEVVIHY